MVGVRDKPRSALPPRYENAAQWVRALGDVPLERIVLNPWPGTATEEDLLEFVERLDRPCELVDGTLVEKPVGYFEGLIAAELVHRLKLVVNQRRLGWVGGGDTMIRMQRGRVRLPDVSFVSRDQLPDGKPPREPIPTLSPTLAVEVLSPSNSVAEIEQKLLEYFESGCRLAWVIDPQARTAVIHQPGHAPAAIDHEGYLDGLDVVPGFSLRLGELFESVE